MLTYCCIKGCLGPFGIEYSAAARAVWYQAAAGLFGTEFRAAAGLFGAIWLPSLDLQKGFCSKSTSQAAKYLQVPLKVFRKFCIFKGVFPWDPKKVKGNHHTYYHMENIAFLKHEPLLEKFCEMHS
nr:pescadillo homolog [Tanacetum cinerariifolium]